MIRHRLKFLLYLVVFVEGMTGLFLELAGAKMMTPLYGGSLRVWANVIGITIGSLTLGYYLGGWLAQRHQGRGVFYIALLISADLLLLPHFADSLIMGLSAFPLSLAVFLAGIILLMPPLVMLGMLVPMIIQVLTTDRKNAGKIAGQLFMISTIGAIMGAFLTGFWWIPEFGIKVSLLFVGSILGLIAVLSLVFMKSFMSSLFVLLIFFNGIYFLTKKGQPASPMVDVSYQTQGILGQLMVVDYPHGFDRAASHYDRMLFVNRMGQTWINLSTKESHWKYVDYVLGTVDILPDSSDALLLGLGGGVLANRLTQSLHYNVDAIELDSRIVKVARQYFTLDNEVNVHIDDARHYIGITEKKYNLVIFDIFKGEMPPAHVLTVECFREVKKKLKTNGVIIVNFHGFVRGEKGRSGRSLLKTLKSAGFFVKMLPTPGPVWNRNMLYIASVKESFFKKSNINWEHRFYDQSTLSLEDAYLLTDNRPVLELINYKAAKKWRSTYNKNFTKKFVRMGVPLFK